MFATGFSMDAERIAEPEDGPTSTFLASRPRAHGVWLYGSVPERPRRATTARATSVVLAGPDGTTHRYAKIHPFTTPASTSTTTPASETVTVEVEGLRVSLFVCYDLRFADDFWPLAPDDRLLPRAAPTGPRRGAHHWQALLQARAIENQAYVVGVNRVGEGGGLAYVGRQPHHRPARRDAGRRRRGPRRVLLADVDAGEVAKVRDRFRFLPDRRTGAP